MCEITLLLNLLSNQGRHQVSGLRRRERWRQGLRARVPGGEGLPPATAAAPRQGTLPPAPIQGRWHGLVRGRPPGHYLQGLGRAKRRVLLETDLLILPGRPANEIIGLQVETVPLVLQGRNAYDNRSTY